jgi:hypothetical protein
LGASDLSSIFDDFRLGQDNRITREEFFKFWSRTSKTMTNAQFAELMQEMMKGGS